ncbi:MAG: hypothetical protein F8N38_03800 [Hungatella sp.]|nr:hypothetical protein [Hungatella sp.]
MGKDNSEQNRICGRLCIMISGVLKAPLLIGSGDNDKTDNDVVLNGAGAAFLPGSSVAGMLRHYLKRALEETDDAEYWVNSMFGAELENNGNLADSVLSNRQSRIFVYDTDIFNPKLIKRDGVRLGQNKTAEYSAKYDYQVIERGASFQLRLEIIQRESDMSQKKEVPLLEQIQIAQNRDLNIIKYCIAGISSGEVRAGAKSRRGLGKLEVKEVKTTAFYMILKEQYMEWLSWGWQKENAFTRKNSQVLSNSSQIMAFCTVHKKQEHCLIVPLKIPGTLLIRQYSSADFQKDTSADSQMIQYGIGEESKAVIPGSSWAGAFRNRIAQLVMRLGELSDWDRTQEYLSPFFGTWKASDEDRTIIPSSLVFEESLVTGGHVLPITRNSIDRFTGGTVTGALFTERVWVGGTTELIIRFPVTKEKEEISVMLGLLIWAIKDLQEGLLCIGGEGGVGRGIFEALGDVTLDNELLQDNEYCQAAYTWCKKINGKGAAYVRN